MSNPLKTSTSVTSSNSTSSESLYGSDPIQRINFWKEEAAKWEKLSMKYMAEAQDLRNKLDEMKHKYNELLNNIGSSPSINSNGSGNSLGNNSLGNHSNSFSIHGQNGSFSNKIDTNSNSSSSSSGSNGGNNNSNNSLGVNTNNSISSNSNNNSGNSLANGNKVSSQKNSSPSSPFGGSSPMMMVSTGSNNNGNGIGGSLSSGQANGSTQPTSIGSVGSNNSFSQLTLGSFDQPASPPNRNGITSSNGMSLSDPLRNLADANSTGGEKKKKKWNLIKFLDKSKQQTNGKKDPTATEDDGHISSGFTYDERGLSTHYHHLPKLQIKPIRQKTKSYVKFSGPDYPVSTEINLVAGGPKTLYQVAYGEAIHALSTSTYPYSKGSVGRDGDPIADRYNCVVYENRLITCLADGCNWGVLPKEAAQKASEAFIEHVISKNDTMHDVKQVGKILFGAFENAHHSIMKGKGEYWEAGTTTLLGGILLEINKGDDKWSPEWEFVLASVGDCKAYLITEGEITDITEGNRISLDPKDCGGRLGPHLEEGKPDLRNLNIFCASVNYGDIILLVTDGVYDNLDPLHLGKTPSDMSREFNLSGSKWADVDLSKAAQAKTAFTTAFLETMLAGLKTPAEIAHRLINHCWDTTISSREYLEQNPGKRLPTDYVTYPGKMDHTTCICFRVGHFEILGDDAASTHSNTSSTSTGSLGSATSTAKTSSATATASSTNLTPSPSMTSSSSPATQSSPNSVTPNSTSPTLHSQVLQREISGSGSPQKDWVKTTPSIAKSVMSNSSSSLPIAYLKKEHSFESQNPLLPSPSSSSSTSPNSSQFGIPNGADDNNNNNNNNNNNSHNLNSSPESSPRN